MPRSNLQGDFESFSLLFSVDRLLLDRCMCRSFEEVISSGPISSTCWGRHNDHIWCEEIGGWLENGSVE